MISVFFWVNITKIPPRFEEPDWMCYVASVVGTFKCPDDKLFDATGEIRVHVEYELSASFYP